MVASFEIPHYYPAHISRCTADSPDGNRITSGDRGGRAWGNGGRGGLGERGAGPPMAGSVRRIPSARASILSRSRKATGRNDLGSVWVSRLKSILCVVRRKANPIPFRCCSAVATGSAAGVSREQTSKENVRKGTVLRVWFTEYLLFIWSSHPQGIISADYRSPMVAKGSPPRSLSSPRRE